MWHYIGTIKKTGSRLRAAPCFVRVDSTLFRKFLTLEDAFQPSRYPGADGVFFVVLDVRVDVHRHLDG